MVGVDETQGVESAPLGVAGAGAGRVLRQVGLHQGQRLLLVAPKQKSKLKVKCHEMNIFLKVLKIETVLHITFSVELCRL
jgi:hypothetical protein